MDVLKMNDGRSIPTLGYGTWRISDQEAPLLIKQAIDVGYRHIDTASAYFNEKGVGEGIRNSGIAREELFVTTKLWNNDQGDPATALKTSLTKLGLDYVDLYLIHWPAPPLGLFVSAWETLITLRKKGLAKSIGVSNFYPKVLDALKPSGARPAVNQVEIHPSFANRETIDADSARGILTESYTPLGRAADLSNPVIGMIASKLGASGAQVIIAWHLTKNLIAIPKASSLIRIRENFEARDLTLTDEDIAAIDALDRGNRLGANPATFTGA